MLSVLSWILAEILLATAGYPLARLMAGSRRDVAPFLAYPLGLVASSYVAWLLGMSGAIPFSPAGCWVAVLITAIGGWALSRHHQRASWPTTSDIPIIFAATASYLAGFSLWLLVRGLDPSANTTEKPMDMAFLSSLIRSASLPPPDPWLSGYSINYYYMGYLAAALQAKLAAIPNTIAFNLAIANYFALTLCGLAGAGLALRSTQSWSAWISPILTASIVLLPGNLYAAFELLRRPAWVLASDWWQGIGWNSTRVIVDQLPGGPWPNITEFPFFSFLLGDMHPHVMALPLMATAVTVLALIATQPRLSLILWAAVTWLLGSLYPWNSWDLPTMIFTYALTTSITRREHGRTWVEVGLIRAGLMTVGAVLFYLPFWLTFRPPVAGPGAPLPPELSQLPFLSTLSRYFGPVIYDHTRLEAFFIVNGIFLIPLALWLIGSYLREASSQPSRVMTRIGAALLAIAVGPAVGVPTAGLLIVLLVLAGRLLFAKQQTDTDRVIASLITTSVLLFLVCETIYIQDAFHNRMNTIFKFYYQAWLLLGIATAALITNWLALLRAPNPAPAATASQLPPEASQNAARPVAAWEARLGLVVGATLLMMGLAYPALAIPKKLMGQRWQGLDASSWIAATAPDEWKAIQWLANNAASETAILEATGPAYSYVARMSTYTGIPTLLGWANHERQWRAGDELALAEIARREGQIASFYRGSDLQVPRTYGVQYMVYGALEQGRIDPRVSYPDMLQRLQASFTVAFHSGNTYIFRRPP